MDVIVKVSHATQCEFVQMTPVPDDWRGKRVRFAVEEIPEDEKTDFDHVNVWPEEVEAQMDLLGAT